MWDTPINVGHTFDELPHERHVINLCGHFNFIRQQQTTVDHVDHTRREQVYGVVHTLVLLAVYQDFLSAIHTIG